MSLTRDDLRKNAKLRRFTPLAEMERRMLRRRDWYSDDQFIHKRHAQALAQVVAAGGRVGVGGHGQFQGLSVHWELELIASGGMPLHDVLRAGTIVSADAIGLAQDLGSIEPGKLADLQVLDRNPLDDIRHTTAIRYVMKNGRLYEGDTLDEVWPRQRPLPRQWWWN